MYNIINLKVYADTTAKENDYSIPLMTQFKLLGDRRDDRGREK